MELFDTHAHLNFRDFNKDREEVINRSLDQGVFIINVGTDLEESKKAIEIAKEYEQGIYASIGLHPLSVAGSDPATLVEGFRKMALSEKVVAIGETGLDYKTGDKKRQKEAFLWQISLARELDLPLVLHCRMAHKDLLDILHSDIKIRKQGVIHCFTGSYNEAKKYLDLGFCLGFNGIIFKMDLERIIKEVPLENILLETDCPFLIPPPEKGRNEPAFVKHIAKEIASIKGISLEKVAEKTTENAKNLFRV